MPPISINELANKALDKAYIQTAGKMLLQVQAVTNNPRSQMQRALMELDEEANRLAEDDKRMAHDNAHLQKALNEYEKSLDVAQTLISANDDAIERAGQVLAIPVVTAKVFTGITQSLARQGVDILSAQALGIFKKQIAASNIHWNAPDVLDFASDYVDSPAWAIKMDKWGSGYAKLTRDTVLNGVQQGWGPKYTAAQLRHHAQNIPKHAAESLTRTLQLTSYRDASVAMEAINGDFIIKKIRIATLDERTCLSCIDLHGTELAPGERVDDHYRGRCSEFYVVPGGATSPDVMQADSKPGKRNFTKYQTGREWFDSLPESRQKLQRSFQSTPAKFNAFKAGTPLSTFVGEHTDDVFGRQFVEKSLVEAVGDKAISFYTRNQ